MVDLIFLSISIVLYFVAPGVFSSGYCWMLLILFLFQAALSYNRDCKIEKIGFHVLFIFAFFLVVYLYPIFIAPFFPNFQILSIPIFDYDCVTKCTALANVAFASYCTGYSIYTDRHLAEITGKRAKRQTVDIPLILNEKQIRVLALFAILFFMLYIALGGLDTFRSMYGEGNKASTGGAASIIWIFDQMLFILLLLCNFKVGSKIIYAIIALFTLLLLALGTRTVPLGIMVPAVCMYCLRKDISKMKILIYGTLFAVTFAAMGIIRSGDSAMDAAGGDAIAEKFRSLMDFIIPNRDLYAIYNHVQNDGITMGVSSTSYILAAVPFCQSIFIAATGIPEYELRSERLTTYWEFGDDKDAWGLGTNIVGDVYLSFGFVGVILLFILLGYLIANMRLKFINGNKYGMIVYWMFVSGVIFMCRGSYFYELKNILWALLVVYLFDLMCKPVIMRTDDKKDIKILPEN